MSKIDTTPRWQQLPQITGWYLRKDAKSKAEPKFIYFKYGEKIDEDANISYLGPIRERL